MKLSLSSCWNSHRHEDGYEMVREILDLGFERMELSHGIRMSLAPGILTAAEEGILTVSSIHNFCPLPVGVQGAAPNLYEPSSPLSRERYMWGAQTMRTIEFAQRVNCPVMVVHSGRTRFRLRDPEGKFEKLVESGAEGAELERGREMLLARLRKSKGRYMKFLKESFAMLVEPCRAAGIRVGVENREGMVELPMDEEMADFLESMGDPDVFGYWHDSGHAQIKHNHGILDHQEFMKEQRARLIGLHLHDVNEAGKDHFAPGTGVIDWDMIVAQIRPDDVVVMEMSPRLKREEILEGKAFLEAKFAERGI